MKRLNQNIPAIAIVTLALLAGGSFIAGFWGLSGLGGAPSRAAVTTSTGASPVSPPPPAVLATDPNIFAALAEKAVPSVVNISTTAKLRAPSPLDRYFGFPGFPGGAMPRALGSGVVVEAEGDRKLILTNHHVIADAESVQVQFSEERGEKSTPAKIIGRDPELDLALLEVKTSRAITPLQLGDSDQLRVGEYVMAVGNPFGHGHSVSHGIISAKGRATPMILGDYLQTDAPINPGNSGGPLLNLKGEIIGINDAILAQAQGIGFAIPANAIRPVLAQLRVNGRVDRGYLGIQLSNAAPSPAMMDRFEDGTAAATPPIVVAVEPKSPAEKAGVQPRDMILSFGGTPVRSARELVLLVSSRKSGDTAELQILRDGAIQKLQVRVNQRPSEPNPT
ncbi:MAG: S1C family serine protease [Bacteriovoracia bacterium]